MMDNLFFFSLTLLKNKINNKYYIRTRARLLSVHVCVCVCVCACMCARACVRAEGSVICPIYQRVLLERNGQNAGLDIAIPPPPPTRSPAEMLVSMQLLMQYD